MSTPTTVWRHVNDPSHMLFAFYSVELDGEVSEEAVWCELHPGVTELIATTTDPDPAEWVELVPAVAPPVTLPAYYGAHLPVETVTKYGRGYFRVERDGSVRYWNPVLGAVTPTAVTAERIWGHPQRYPRMHGVPPQVAEAFQL